MIHINIYGTGTSGHQLAKLKLTKYLDEAGIDFNMKETTHIKDILSEQIENIPCIKVNDDKIFNIKQNGQYSSSLRTAIQEILKIENYGEMKKIIVPTDFSETSHNAINFASNLAEAIRGVLLLTHVYYPTTTDVNQFAVVNQEVEKIRKNKLNALVKTLNKDWIGNFVKEPFIEGIFKVGFPRLELAELSQEPDTLMVMGTTGEGDAFKNIFGSLSLDMIENCYCPLFLVPPNANFHHVEELVYLSEDLKNDVNHLLLTGTLCSKLQIKMRIIHFKTKSSSTYAVKNTEDLIQKYFPDLSFHIDIIDTTDIFDSVKNLVQKDDRQIVTFSTKHRNIFQNIFHKSVTEFAALHSWSPLLILSDSKS